MPSLVNRVPPGLLSLLGIKAGGQNPSILPDVLTPTLELMELYSSANATEAAGTTSAVNLTGLWGIAALQPGPGEIFLVERMTVDLVNVLAAGTTMRVQPCFYQNYPYTVGLPAEAGPGEVLSVFSQRPFILPAGHRLALFASKVVLGVAAQFRIQARYLALTI